MIIKRILDKPLIVYSFISVSVFIVLVCVFTPDIIFFKQLSNYTVHIMLGFLLLGLLFLVLGSNKLLLTSFLSSAVLSLFLKYSSNPKLQLSPDTGLPSFSVVLVNLADITIVPDSFIYSIQKIDPDLIFFNELTPDWTGYLTNAFRKSHPYQVQITRIDNNGKALFSRLPILSTDTLVYSGIPHILSRIRLGPSVDISVLNTFFNPPLVHKMLVEYNAQLEFLIGRISKLNEPLLIAGDFSVPPWSTELRAFKYAADLNDSRRDIALRSGKGFKALLNVPVQQIFFNHRLACIKFSGFYDGSKNKMGITGVYQLTLKNSVKKLEE